jgi:hypothetical protein
VFGVAREVEALGIENYRSFVLGKSPVIRSLCILGVAGRCRIEKGLGTCMGRYCTADFDRRSSIAIIHSSHELQTGAPLLVRKSMKGIVSPWGCPLYM